jgi:alpha-tubulin suppressor-like RCC1 family protein
LCYSWGSDEYGQLGHNQGAATLRVPRLVKSLGTLKVTAVAAGMYHSAALTASGQLFTWGSNSKGQLGLGSKFNMVFSPTLVDCLAGVPLAGLACGANHSLVVTVSGAVFAWGANSHGQLGLGDFEDRLVPTQAVLWIRIRKDPKLFAGSGSVTRSYGSGSGLGSDTGLKSY